MAVFILARMVRFPIRPAFVCLAALVVASGCDRGGAHKPAQPAAPDEPEPGAATEPTMSTTDELLDGPPADDLDETELDAERADTSAIEAVDTPKDAFDLMRQQLVDDDAFHEVALWRLQMLRNAPFARAGYEFDTPWLAAYFWRQPAVYEPGGFEDGALTELERHNASRIRAYERRLSTAALQDRWDNLWAEYDIDAPDGPWATPGPWDRIEDRLEARILAEHLDTSHPADPLFDAEANRPIPRGFGGVELGEDAPDHLGSPSSRSSADPAFAFDTMTIGIRGHEGEIRDVVGGEFYHPHDEPPATKRALMTSIETQMTAAFGSPDQTDFYAAWVHDTAIWRAEDRVMIIGFLAAPEEHGAVAAIRPADSSRPCGPDDGFDEVVEAIATAHDDDDMEAFSEYLPERFGVEGILVSEDGEMPAEDEDGHQAYFDAQSYDEFFSIENTDGDRWRESGHGCSILHPHHVLTGVSALNAVFRKHGDTWKLSGITEWVAGAYHLPGSDL